jgi:hypothetical protein
MAYNSTYTPLYFGFPDNGASALKHAGILYVTYVFADPSGRAV